MKARAFGALLLTILLTAKLAAQSTATVTADQVRLRSGPSTNAKVVAILNKDATVTVVHRNGEWVEVRSGFTTGYVHSSYLSGGSASAPVEPSGGSMGTAAASAPSQSATSEHQGPAHPASGSAAPSTSASRKGFSAYAGIAGGSGGWGLGFGGGAEYAFPLSNPALAIRVQAEFFHFSDSQSESVSGASASASSNMFGANGAVEYSFHTSSPKLVPYAIAGLGFYYNDVTANASVAGYSASASESSSSLAMSLGGGLRFSRNLFAEVRFVPFFSGGSMFPIVVGYRF